MFASTLHVKLINNFSSTLKMDTNTARFNMIEQQIRPWGVFDPVTLSTLAEVPREVFVPEKYSDLAFADYEIPIGNNQFMMNPKIEGHLLQALELKASDKALEIGTGSGFITASVSYTHLTLPTKA